MIRIGPAGWTHPRLEAVWPEERGAGFEPLAFLGARFGCIEVDVTAHGPPPRSHVSRWAVALAEAERTRLSVRLPDALMSLAPAAGAERERLVGEMRGALGPILGRPRLAALVGALGVDVLSGPSEIRALAAIARGLRGTPLVLEAAHPSWHEPRGRDGAAGAGWTLAHVEAPADWTPSPPAPPPRPGGLAMLRILREGVPDAARAARLADRARALSGAAAEVLVVAAQRGGDDPSVARLLTALAIKRALAPQHTPPAWPELARAAARPGRPQP